MILTTAEVKTLRQEINAAHAAGDADKAAELQGRLHQHFVADSDAFVTTPEGAAWLARQRATV